MLKKTPNYFFSLTYSLYAILVTVFSNLKIILQALLTTSLLFTSPLFLNDSVLSTEREAQNQEDLLTVLELKKEIAKIREDISDYRKGYKKLNQAYQGTYCQSNTIHPSLPEKEKASIKGSPLLHRMFV